jgi:hypothetical protein
MSYSIHVPQPSVGLTSTNGISTNAIELRNKAEMVLSISQDGKITTQSGTVHVDDWVTTVNVMKQLIMDLSKDEDLASKYPYIRETAHRWLVDELRK